MKLTKKTVIIIVAILVVIAVAITGTVVLLNKNNNIDQQTTENPKDTNVIDSTGDVVPFSSDDETEDDGTESTVDTSNEKKEDKTKSESTTEENQKDNSKNTTDNNDSTTDNGDNNSDSNTENDNGNNNGNNGGDNDGDSADKSTQYNYSYAEMVQNGDTLISKYGDKISKEVIGTTLFGRDIIAYKVGNNNASRKMLVVSGVNGSEHDNAIVMMKQIETYIADTTATYKGQKYADIINGCQIYFVPMLNPDGIEISINGLSSVPEQYKSSVESIADYSVENGLMDEGDYSSWNANGQGIDVSINFGSGTVVSNTLSEVPASRSYPGEPFASNEATAIKNLCNSINFETATVYAGTGNLIDWSFGQINSAQLSESLANGLTLNTGLTIISNGPTYDFCISVNLAQWFIYQYDRPAFSILMGTDTPYTKKDTQSMWKAVSTAPLFLAVEGNGATDYEIIE